MGTCVSYRRLRRLIGTSVSAMVEISTRANAFCAEPYHAQFALGGVGIQLFKYLSDAALFILFYFHLKQCSTFCQSHSYSISIIPHGPSLFPISLQNMSNAIRCFERYGYFPAATSVRPYVDCLDTSSRIQDVTPRESPKAFQRRGRFTIFVPHRVLSAGSANARSVIGHAPRLDPRLDPMCLCYLGKNKVGSRGELLTETHGSGPTIKVSASWDPNVFTVDRGAVREITFVLILVLVWSHRILHEKKNT